MTTIAKFTVVKATGLHNGRAAFASYSPSEDTTPEGLVAGHAVYGVTATTSEEDDDLVVLQSGYLRGLGSGDMTGWEPADGALLWAGPGGKPTTTRPTSGVQVFVGTYLGDGVVDCNVRLVPSLSELSFVSRESPAALDVLIFDAATGQWVPRQLVHGADLATLDADDHPQYPMRRWAWYLGD